MSPPKIELTIMAAEGLKNVSLLRGRMDPYAVAFIDPRSKHSTRVLHRGGKDPVWNDSLEIPFDDRSLYDPYAALTIQVFHHSPINTALAGATQLMLQDLLRHAAIKGNGEGDILTLQLFRPSGRTHGIIRVFLKVSGNGLPTFSRLFGSSDVDAAAADSCADAPATGIPLMQMQNAADYRSDKFSYAYPYPASAYSQASYLPYPAPPSQCPRRNNNFLFGLLGGAVAAVLLGALF